MISGPNQHGVAHTGLPVDGAVPTGSGNETPALTVEQQIPRKASSHEQKKQLSVRLVAEFDPLYSAESNEVLDSVALHSAEPETRSFQPETLPSHSDIKSAGKNKQTIRERLSRLCFALLARTKGRKPQAQPGTQPLITIQADDQPGIESKNFSWGAQAEFCQPLAPEKIWKDAGITEEDLLALEELKKVAAEGGDEIDNSVAERIWRLLSRMAKPLKPTGQKLENIAGKVVSNERLTKLEGFIKKQLKNKVKYEVTQNLGRRAIQILLLTGASSVLGPAATALPILLKLWRVSDVWREGRALYCDRNPIPALKDASVNLLPWLVMKMVL
ncbi:hypothetical protein EOPP23_01440 [Endozoicomonas sp. OPT23]|uniref:hypothetical protein n=1 Tax=Endozoicomonas sp. OPT23 TaxID=2072845 RepID=UPI00129A4421|nr:hypothetical protein [Endozoicomonas sp. OPT23]MRI31657.1 hypothetical protein [Endozoicomonas sp. OPT23]